jgi:energy-coupling factor transporter transmembrane protein EcfT
LRNPPTIADFFVGLAVMIGAFLFPAIVFGALLLFIVVAGMGGKRYGNFFVGLVMIWFAWRFPMFVLSTLLISFVIIAAGKAVSPRRSPVHSGS